MLLTKNNLYRKLSEGAEIDKMDRTRFREFLHNAFDMTDDILLDRIFKYFDDDNDGFINREEWINGLSVFMKGTYNSETYIVSFSNPGVPIIIDWLFLFTYLSTFIQDHEKSHESLEKVGFLWSFSFYINIVLFHYYVIF